MTPAQSLRKVAARGAQVGSGGQRGQFDVASDAEFGERAANCVRVLAAVRDDAREHATVRELAHDRRQFDAFRTRPGDHQHRGSRGPQESRVGTHALRLLLRRGD